VDVLEIVVVHTRRSETSSRPPISTVLPPSWRGMRVDDATAAPREALLGIQLPDSGGLYVADVAPDSSAWKAGLRAGMFLTAVAGEPVTTAQEFFVAVDGQAGPVTLEQLTGPGSTTTQTVSP
jgi:S1-C subfamily serine protease